MIETSWEPTPDDIRGWNRFENRVYGRIEPWLHGAVDLEVSVLDSVLHSIFRSGSESPEWEAAKQEMHEILDNWINQGDQERGFEWAYREEAPPQGHPRPTGKPGEAILGLQTQKERKRKYIGLTILLRHYECPAGCGPTGGPKCRTCGRVALRKEQLYEVTQLDQLRVLARKVAHWRLYRGRHAVDSLDDLAGSGEEIPVSEPGYQEIESQMTPPEGATGPPITPEELARWVRVADDKLLSARGRTGSVPWKFAVLTRSFLAYVVAACRMSQDNPPMYHGWPTFAQWLSERLGRAPLLDDQTATLMMQDLDDPGTAGILPEDLLLAELLERLKDPRIADATRRHHARFGKLYRQVGASLIGRSTVAHTEASLETVCREHFARLARRLDAYRWSQLKEDLDRGAWQALSTSAEIDDVLKAPELDRDRWCAVAQPGILKDWQKTKQVAAIERMLPPDAELPITPYHPLYDLWHDACFALLVSAVPRWLCPGCGARPELRRLGGYTQATLDLADDQLACGVCGARSAGVLTAERNQPWWHAGGSGSNKGQRTSLDTAKSRADSKGDLDEFYDLIGHAPSDRLADSDRRAVCHHVRQAFDAFPLGNVGPEEATEFREHLAECDDCFWAFSDYIRDRIAWGFQPQPTVAALRERLRAARGGPAFAPSVGVRRLMLRLGDLPVDLREMRDRLRQQLAQVATAPSLVPVSRAVVSKDAAGRFAGFQDATGKRIQPGQRVAVYIRDVNDQSISLEGTDGQPTDAQGIAEIVTVTCDPETREASLTMKIGGLPEIARVVVAQAEAHSLRYSLAAEVCEGEVTLSIYDCPEELDHVRIVRWYALAVEPAESP